MRRVLAAAGLAATMVMAAAVSAGAAANPSGTGPPSQSCQAINGGAVGPFLPGHAANSPGSPFDEPGGATAAGGTGGQHYSAQSQYDVACYQMSQH